MGAKLSRIGTYENVAGHLGDSAIENRSRTRVLAQHGPHIFGEFGVRAAGFRQQSILFGWG
jgi:hypothetical protein